MKRQLKDLKPNPKNPRRISSAARGQLTESLEEFSDIGCIIFNRRTGRLVGGHQRVNQFKKIDPKASVKITSRNKTPTESGTVAEGYLEINGERFAFREVDWDEKKERVANVAANRQGGEFVEEMLAELMNGDEINGELAGFEEGELEVLLSGMQNQTPPEPDGKSETQASHVRMVQLFLTTETKPTFEERIATLAVRYGTSNVTDTVMECLRRNMS